MCVCVCVQGRQEGVHVVHRMVQGGESRGRGRGPRGKGTVGVRHKSHSPTLCAPLLCAPWHSLPHSTPPPTCCCAASKMPPAIPLSPPSPPPPPQATGTPSTQDQADRVDRTARVGGGTGWGVGLAPSCAAWRRSGWAGVRGVRGHVLVTRGLPGGWRGLGGGA